MQPNDGEKQVNSPDGNNEKQQRQPVELHKQTELIKHRGADKRLQQIISQCHASYAGNSDNNLNAIQLRPETKQQCSVADGLKRRAQFTRGL